MAPAAAKGLNLRSSTLVYYVSGHGFGHAVRSAEILREVQRLRPDWCLVVRTMAPAALFGEGCEVLPLALDSGACECGQALDIDVPRSLAALENVVRDSAGLVADEAEFLRATGAKLVAADVPWMAAAAARSAGIRSIAISNFTWLWIWEPFLPVGSRLIESLRSGYTLFDLALRLPFSGETDFGGFGKVEDVPLVGRSLLQKQRWDSRPTVFLAGRSPVPLETMQSAARQSPDFFFVTGGKSREQIGPNLFAVPIGKTSAYVDAFAAADLVVAKLGYSLVADSICSGKRLLYPPRANFREDEVTSKQISSMLPALQMSRADYFEGRWGAYLKRLQALPEPPERARTNGASVCAERLVLECEKHA